MQRLDLRTLLRIAQGIQGDPEIRDNWGYSTMAAAITRHEASLMGRDLLPRPVDAAAAMLHTIVLLKPLAFANDVFGWIAAYTLLGVNGLRVEADPQEAVDFVQAVAAGKLEERQIAERLAGFIVT